LQAQPRQPIAAENLGADLPRRLAALFDNPFLRHYSRWKTRLDPAYPAVARALANAPAEPLLDLGCGAGLLAFYLRLPGYHGPVRALDLDPRKIDAATRASRSLPGQFLFAQSDLAHWRAGDHAGHVCLIDVLQYQPPDGLARLLGEAASCLRAPAHRLVIHSGLADASWRSRVSALGDRFATWTGWMATAPGANPTPHPC
jgi:SAM-dependent methyltransferase